MKLLAFIFEQPSCALIGDKLSKGANSTKIGFKPPLHYNELTGRSFNELQTYEKSRIRRHSLEPEERDHRCLT